jgi:hypothetical protein
MQTRGSIAALSAAAFLVVAVGTFSAAGIRTAAADECTGPFRQCAIEVRAICSRDPDGKQRMTYGDYPGNTMGFERCVARVFAAAGQPDPYKTPAGRQTGGKLTIPYSDVFYPRGEMRN